MSDWILAAAQEISRRLVRDGDRSDVLIAEQIIRRHAPKPTAPTVASQSVASAVAHPPNSVKPVGASSEKKNV